MTLLNFKHPTVISKSEIMHTHCPLTSCLALNNVSFNSTIKCIYKEKFTQTVWNKYNVECTGQIQEPCSSVKQVLHLQ